MKIYAGLRHPAHMALLAPVMAAGIAALVDPPNRPRAALLAFPTASMVYAAVHATVPSRRSAPRAHGLAIAMLIARVARAAIRLRGPPPVFTVDASRPAVPSC
jgi:hypothetical protein